MSIRASRGSLLLCSVLAFGTACTDSPLTPSAASATQPEDGDQQLLLAILAKLDSIESRVERESSAIYARLDALAAGDATALVAGGPGGSPRSNGLSSQVEALHVLTDSIMELSSFLATDAAQVLNWEFCGGVKADGGGEFKAVTQGDAEAQAGVGAKPADTGAAAQVEVTQRVAMEWAAAVKLELGTNVCADLRNIGSSPPVRTSTSPAALRMAGGDMETTLLALQSQLGLDESNMDRAFTAGADLFQNGSFSSLNNLTTSLPLPAQFSSPLTVVRNQLAGTRPVDLLCDADLGSGRIMELAAEGCGFIQADNLPDLGTFLDLSRNFTSLRDNFDGVCSRVNSMVNSSVNIGLSSWGDGTLNLRLFPSGWVVSCTT